MRDDVNKKQKDYLQYVVDELIDNTLVDVRDQKIWHPYDSHYSRHLIGGAKGGFVDFVEDKFGVLRSEVDLVWSHYKHRIKDENGWVQIDPFDGTLEAIRFAMSESREHNKGSEEFKKIDNPKQHRLYNKIADKVIELTEVRDEQWGRGIFLTDLLDPDYPGQGMSLPPAINMSDYESFQKRMLTIVDDFFPMLEKYWFIEDIFDQIFILTRFVFPKLWNNFYKGEDQPEESTEYGEHALDYEEKMGDEFINESWEDNYVDRIVDQLIDETYIVKEKRTPRRGKSKWLYFVRNPFMGVTPNFTVFLYVLIQTDPGEQFQKHCREIYGATPDQIKDIWSSYTYYLSEIKPEFDTESDTLRKAIEPINESITQDFFDSLKYQGDNKEELDRIVKNIVNGTIFHRKMERPSVELPELQQYMFTKNRFFIGFYVFNPTHELYMNPDFHHLLDSIKGMFSKHGKDIYGLTDEENEYVWKQYKSIISDKIKSDPSYEYSDPLNESTYKQQKFLDVILKDMVNQSDIYGSEFGSDTLITPAGIEVFNFHLLIKMLTPPPYLTSYMRDTYGLTDDELNHIWLRYKDIMLHKIKQRDASNNPFRITESTKPLPDRIFQMIHDDLFNRTVKIPRTNYPICTGGDVMGFRTYDQPNFVIQLNLPSSEFPYNVEMGRERSWGQLNDYLTQQYGLTQEECDRVWDEYRGTICKNAKLPFVNESRDKQQEAEGIIHPHLSEEEREDPYSFAWHPDQRKRKFYEAVLRDVVNASVIGWDGVIYVGDPVISHKKGLEFHNIYLAYDVTPFLHHLKDTYGLLDNETHPIWSRWEHIMVDKMKKWLKSKDISFTDAGYDVGVDYTDEHIWDGNEEINESEEDEIVYTTDKKKEKQQKVLDYAIEDITNNTLLDWGYNEYHNDGNSYQIIRFPFSIYPHEDPTKNRLEWIVIDPHYNVDIAQFYKQFKPYVRMMYGLTQDEIIDMFPEWETKIIEKIRDHAETDPPRP